MTDQPTGPTVSAREASLFDLFAQPDRVETRNLGLLWSTVGGFTTEDKCSGGSRIAASVEDMHPSLSLFVNATNLTRSLGLPAFPH